MGKAYVEIGADSRKFFGALGKVNGAVKAMGASIASAGAKLTAAGLSAVAPFAASIRSGAAYQDQLLGIKASTGATAEQLQAVDETAMKLSKDMGIGPAAIAASFQELLKAGMPLQQVLDGAGRAATEFAKVGGLDMAQAAVVMSDAMNVFGVTAKTAVDTLSAAADSSSTNIAEVVEAFANVGAIAASANQSITTMSAAVAILGNNMIKGGEAGTALKSMMLPIMSGADGAAKALAKVGLTLGDFRDASGQMLPLGQSMDLVKNAISGLGKEAQDAALLDIFGSYGMKAAIILMGEGEAGFKKMEQTMAGASSVGTKFGDIMSGLSGAGSKMMAAIERLAIAVSNALAPSLTSAATSIADVINMVTQWVTENQAAVLMAAKVTVGVIAAGAALTVLGVTMVGISSAISTIFTVATALLSPLGMVAVVGVAAFAALDVAMQGPFSTWMAGQKMIADAVEPWIAFIQNVITSAGTNIAIGWEYLWFGMSQTVKTIGAVMMGTIDNFVTPILNLFDEIKLAVSAVAYEIDQATTLSEGTHAKQKQQREEYVAKIRGGMEERSAQSGIVARVKKVGEEGDIAKSEMLQRTGAMTAAADKTMADRLQAAEDRRKERELAAAPKPKSEPTPLATPGTPAATLPPALAAASGGIAAAVDLKNESMGSFSALSAGGQGIGSTVTIQKDQLDMLKKINTTLETLGPYVA